MQSWQIQPKNKVINDDAKLGNIVLHDSYFGGRGNRILDVKGTDHHDLVGMTLRNYVVMPAEQLALEVGDYLFEYAQQNGTLPDVMSLLQG